MWTSRQWSAEPIGKRLREQSSLIFTISRENHERIHKETPPVPLLGYYALLSTLHNYEPAYNPVKDIDGLCGAIEKATRTPRAHQIERDLAGLAIEAIQLQKPIIFEGILT